MLLGEKTPISIDIINETQICKRLFLKLSKYSEKKVKK